MATSRRERAEAEQKVYESAVRLDWDTEKINRELAKIDDGTSRYLSHGLVYRAAHGDPAAVLTLLLIGAGIFVALVIVGIIVAAMTGGSVPVPMDD